MNFTKINGEILNLDLVKSFRFKNSEEVEFEFATFGTERIFSIGEKSAESFVEELYNDIRGNCVKDNYDF